MQLVDERWYQWYSRLATAFAGLLVIGCVLSWVLPGYKEIGKDWGLNYVTLAASLAIVAYRIFGYNAQAKSLGASQAMIILSSIQSINAMNLMHSTGMMESWYLIYWGVILFLAGMFGTFAIAGVYFILAMYYILFSRDSAGNLEFSLFGTIGIAVLFVVCFISHFFWRKQYVSADSATVKKLSGQLKSKQQQAEVLLQSITDGIILINNEGKIGLMNMAASKMTEWPVDEGTGIDIKSVIKLAEEDGKELDEQDNPIKIALETGQASSKTLQLIGRGGKTQVVSISVSPLKTSDTEIAGAVAAIRDVTDARGEEKRRADFISTASHEMRTPVAAIEGYLALALNEHVSKIDQKAREYLEKAHSSTEHLGKLFQDLLTSAKAEDGRLVSHPVAVEMGAYLDQLVESLRFAAEKKGLLMDFTVGTAAQNGANMQNVVKPLYYVLVDPDRLREVITNLFDNAVKYTPSGRVSVGLTGNDQVVQFYVRDTGPGIPADDVPHLFQKFYRVDNSSTRTVGGTGLGLFICKKIIEIYKGRIWAESEVGKGSTFYMNLPRVSSTKALELQREEAGKQTSAPVTSLTTPVV